MRIEDNNVVEKLSPNRADESLDIRALPGRGRCGDNLADAKRSDFPLKSVSVYAIAIAPEEG